MALKSQLPEIQYRVSVHGTLAASAIPAFHTPQLTLNIASSSRVVCGERGSHRCLVTGFSYTGLPHSGSRLHRETAHDATGGRYTEVRRTTGEPYTRNRLNL